MVATFRARSAVAASFLLLAGLLVACAAGDGPAAPAAVVAPGTEILWDRWGIPHVRAADSRSLFFAYGWAQAHHHAELLLRDIGAARGRGAEYWGEKLLDDDLWYWRTGLPGWAEERYAALDPEIRGYVDAFARGIMAYVEQHPEAVPEEVAAVLPVGGVDVVANAGAVGLRFSGARRAAERWLGSQGRGGEVAWGPHHAPRAVAASNAWAIGGAKSASGHALLLANPHLPWSGSLTWIEAQLTSPDVDVYGASLVGFPVINIGFNRHLGWTHTVNTQDSEDLYELELVGDGEGIGYRFAGAVRPLARRVVEVKVRGPQGLRRQEVELLTSVHGPVVARAGGKALALRRVEDLDGAIGEPFRQWWEMARAADLDGFEAALAHQAIVGQNVVYADAGGHIAYFYGAATPRRSRGDVDFWSGIVPGDDPELVWDAVHPFAEMPRLVDPPSGWVQNSNDPPWRSSWPPVLEPEAFPAYFAPSRLSFRSQRSIELLRQDGKLDLEEMVRRKHSTEVEMADRLLPELLAAARADGGATARRAAEVLAAWDRTTDAGSRGAVLFDSWAEEAFRRSGAGVFAEGWDPARPLDTPDGLADPAAAVAALEAAAARVEAEHGRLDVSWGEVHRLVRDGVDLPGNGGPGSLGIFRVVNYGDGEGPTQRALAGDSFVLAVEFGEPHRAFALLAYGNASQAGSPHRTDQLQLFADKALRPVLFGAEEVAAQAVDRTRF